MKKNKFFLAVLLTAAISLLVSVSVSAQSSTGTIELNCTDIRLSGTVATGELVRLEIRLHDTSDWQSPRIQDDYIVLGPGPYDVTVPWVGDPSGRLHRVVINASTDGGTTWQRLAGEEGVIDCPPPPAEVCSPGYWKNHIDAWVGTGYSPNDDFDTTFGVSFFSPDITLLGAVNLKGGGVNQLARIGTAALLNASALNYPLTTDEVIAAVQAGNVSLLNSFGENCPLD